MDSTANENSTSLSYQGHRGVYVTPNINRAGPEAGSRGGEKKEEAGRACLLGL